MSRETSGHRTAARRGSLTANHAIRGSSGRIRAGGAMHNLSLGTVARQSLIERVSGRGVTTVTVPGRGKWDCSTLLGASASVELWRHDRCCARSMRGSDEEGDRP